jgi:hypothetical protein
MSYLLESEHLLYSTISYLLTLIYSLEESRRDLKINSDIRNRLEITVLAGYLGWKL